jgi:TPR repeat protein
MFVVVVLALGLAQSAADGAASQSQSAVAPSAASARLSSSDVSQLQAKAEAGDASSQVALGSAYRDGDGISQNDALAVVWYRKAAEQGNATAQNDLGNMYRAGAGIEKNREEAVKWYRMAARQGNGNAMFNLGTAYYNGDGVPSNVFLAYDWFLLGEEAGNPKASDAVRRTGPEIGKQACLDSLMEVAGMYEKGQDLRQNPAEAAKWYRKGSDQKDARAMVRLAILLLNGQGVQRDYTEAERFCREAAREYPPAQHCLGYIYQHGFGVAKDDREAAKWYEKAAIGGHPGAMFSLAQMYAQGDGVGEDRPQAYLLFFQAYSKTGDQVTKQAAVDLVKKMNKGEIKELEKKLRERRLDPQKVFDMMGTKPGS